MCVCVYIYIYIAEGWDVGSGREAQEGGDICMYILKSFPPYIELSSFLTQYSLQ